MDTNTNTRALLQVSAQSQLNRDIKSNNIISASTPAGSLAATSASEKQLDVDIKPPVFIPFPPNLPSIEEIIILVGALQSTQSEGQLDTASIKVKLTSKHMQDINIKARAAIDKWKVDSEATTEKGNWMGILGTVIKSLAFVGAVAAVVMTGGLSAPLLAVAVVGIIGTGISLSSDILVRSGGKGFELNALILDGISGLVDDAGDCKIITGLIGLPLIIADPSFFGILCSGIAEKCGADEVQSAIVMSVFTVVAGLALAGGIASAAKSAAKSASNAVKAADSAVEMTELGAKAASTATQTANKLSSSASSATPVVADTTSVTTKVVEDVATSAGNATETVADDLFDSGLKASSATSKVAKSSSSATSRIAFTAELIAKLLYNSTGITNGLLGITQSGIGVNKALDQQDADDALVEKNELDVISTMLKKTILNGQDEMKKLYEEILNIFDGVSGMINDQQNSITQLNKNYTPTTA